MSIRTIPAKTIATCDFCGEEWEVPSHCSPTTVGHIVIADNTTPPHSELYGLCRKCYQKSLAWVESQKQGFRA